LLTFKVVYRHYSLYRMPEHVDRNNVYPFNTRSDAHMVKRDSIDVGVILQILDKIWRAFKPHTFVISMIAKSFTKISP